MAVNVSFWSGFSKKKNSTKQPAGAGTTHACLLKEASSIEEPVFILATGDPTNYNYCSAYGNYYYVTLKEYVPPHWHIYCELDPMATYKSQIGASSLYVTRSYSGFWNERLVDSVPIMCNTVNQRVMRDGDDRVPFPFDTSNAGCYVVTVVASNTNNGACFYVLTPSEYTFFARHFYNVDTWTDVNSGTPMNFDPDVKALLKPWEYIQDVRWYPLPKSRLTSEPSEQIHLNNWNTQAEGSPISGVNTVKVGGSTFTIPKHPQSSTLGEYLNTNSFSRYTLYDPFVGVIPIDANEIASSEVISVDYRIDVSCGKGLAYVYGVPGTSTGNGDVLITASSFEFGVPVLFTARSKDALNSVMSGLGNMNPLGAIWGIVQSEASPKMQVMGSIASRASYQMPPYLYCEFNEIVPIDRSLVGYPCCRTLLISTLNGFVQCQTGDINVPCPPTYKAQIKTYLEGGFFYE